MKKETLLIAVVALIIGLLGGYLVFTISGSKNQQTTQTITPGSGTPVDYERRIAEAEKVVAQDPKNLSAWLSLGNDYFDTEQSQKSINAYSKALEIEPNNPNTLTDQGVMYRKVGWFDKAIANFEKAQQIDPNHLQSLFNIGIVYFTDLKQPEKSKPYWDRYLKLDSNSTTAVQIKGMMGQAGGSMPPANMR